jgi:hypothetical protein
MSEGQTLSAIIRERSPSEAAEVPRQDRRYNESAFPLNSLNLDDHSCLVRAVDQPSGEPAPDNKVLAAEIRLCVTSRLIPEIITLPSPKKNGKTGRTTYDLRTTCYSSSGIPGLVL